MNTLVRQRSAVVEWLERLGYGAKSHRKVVSSTPGLEVIKLFSCSTQLSMKFFLLINVKMPTIVGILTFMSGKKIDFRLI